MIQEKDFTYKLLPQTVKTSNCNDLTLYASNLDVAMGYEVT